MENDFLIVAGSRLHRRNWLPEAAPKAVVMLCHGYGEHAGRYDHVAGLLASNGLAVCALDHWGHGQSDGVPGYVARFPVYLDGVEALLAKVKEEFPGLPRILIGHSMGGLIAAAHLLDHQGDYVGAALSGPLILPAAPPSWAMIRVSRMLSRLTPRLGVLALDKDGVSRDPAVVAAYRADPLVYSGKMSARLAAEMFDAMAMVRERCGEITLPMLMQHGEADRLTAPAGSQWLNERIASADKTLKLYPELYHEIFNEPERDAVLADLTGWIADRLPKDISRI